MIEQIRTAAGWRPVLRPRPPPSASAAGWERRRLIEQYEHATSREPAGGDLADVIREGDALG